MDSQISLSFEVICLISWLLKHEQPALAGLIKQAIENGFLEDYKHTKDAEGKSTHFPQTTVVDFLEFLEHTLAKQIENKKDLISPKNAIFPALQTLEAKGLDVKTMLLSMNQAKAVIKAQANIANTDNAEQKPSELLFEQILKNWKPNSKETLN